ncbi:unnamed protein product [Mytilus coruscus]|uniref:Uncharacterized protein n=1 Tax=Mytilus coruscus TaxID=42192 RepID=A0A6J8EQY0_MYTCO|nr:unnamed protein product [Mytilus coruscus]
MFQISVILVSVVLLTSCKSIGNDTEASGIADLVKQVEDLENKLIKFYIFLLTDCKAIGNETEASDISDLVKQVEDLQNKLTNLSDNLTKDQVLLYVTLSESMKDVSNEVTVIFDRPLINPGTHYNQNDGIYIAPFSGQVMVFWTIGTNETAKRNS